MTRELPSVSRDVDEAVAHAQEVFGDECALTIDRSAVLPSAPTSDVEAYDDVGAWLEMEPGELAGLGPRALAKRLEEFRGTPWAKRALSWRGSDGQWHFPPLVIVTCDDPWFTVLGDGRGRYNLAVGLGLESVPLRIVRVLCERPRPRKNPGRQMPYAPNVNAPVEGMWVRDPGPAWVQHHRALVTAALRSWSGSPAEMKLHLDDAAAGAPMPASGSGKIMRAQAEALAWEIAHAPRRSRGTLYRGSHVEPRGVQSWSSRRKVAERWAAKNGGRVWTLPPGTPGIRRTDYASTVFDEEAEWLVWLP